MDRPVHQAQPMNFRPRALADHFVAFINDIKNFFCHDIISSFEQDATAAVARARYTLAPRAWVSRINCSKLKVSARAVGAIAICAKARSSFSSGQWAFSSF